MGKIPEEYIDIVFNGPPGPISGRFVEVEDKRGRSINAGKWVERKDGLWALRICTLLQEVDGDESVREIKVRHVSIDHVLQFFKSKHLPSDLQSVVVACGGLAEQMADELPSNPETTVGLRKLLEAKDCFVRAKLIGKVL